MTTPDSLEVLFPTKMFGVIIGEKGSSISEIRNENDVKIQTDKFKQTLRGSYRLLRIDGKWVNLWNAFCQICKVIDQSPNKEGPKDAENSNPENNNPDAPFTLTIQIKILGAVAGQLIGKKGANMNKWREEHPEIKMDIDNDEENQLIRWVKVTATPFQMCEISVKFADVLEAAMARNADQISQVIAQLGNGNHYASGGFNNNPNTGNIGIGNQGNNGPYGNNNQNQHNNNMNQNMNNSKFNYQQNNQNNPMGNNNDMFNNAMNQMGANMSNNNSMSGDLDIPMGGFSNGPLNNNMGQNNNTSLNDLLNNTNGNNLNHNGNNNSRSDRRGRDNYDRRDRDNRHDRRERTPKRDGNRYNNNNNNSRRNDNHNNNSIMSINQADSHNSVLNTGFGQCTTNIVVADNVVGKIIGKDGEVIKNLRNASGCQIRTDGKNDRNDGLREISICGMVPQVQIAITMIQAQVTLNQGAPNMKNSH